MMKKLILNLGLFAALAGTLSAGEIVTYQGRLKESGSPANGNRTFLFDFCATDVPSGCIASLSGAQSFQVSNGLFKSTFTAPAVDLSAGPWYLRVWVDGTALSPVERLTHVPYAVHAASAAYASALSVASGQGVYASTNVAVAGSLTVSDFSIVPSTEAMVGVSTLLKDVNPAGEDVRVAITGYAMSGSADPKDVLAAGNFEAEVPATMNGMMVGVRTVSRNYGSSPKAIGLMVDSVQNTGTLAETYGIWIATMTGGTQSSRPYALYSGDPNAASYFAGPVGISSVPAYSLAVSSGTGDIFWVAHDSVHAVKFVGDGSGLTGVTGASGTDNTKVLKTGDFMSGQLTIGGSSLTVRTGNAVHFAADTTGKVGINSYPDGMAGLSIYGSGIYDSGIMMYNGGTNWAITNNSGVLTIVKGDGATYVPLQINSNGDMTLFRGAYYVGGSTFSVVNSRVGVGTPSPLYLMHVSTGAGETGSLLVLSTGTSDVVRMTGEGKVYANKFYGDGSSLTGIVADLNSPSGTLAVADGGTGGANAADARTNLGVVALAGDTMTGPLAFSLNNAVFSNSVNTGGIVISTGGAITTTGPGTGSVSGNARGLGAVDLQTARGSAAQVAAGNYSTIGGGIANSAVQSYATVGGGFSNYAGGDDATVSGGYSNGALGYASAVGGGVGNSAPGTMAAITGGDNNSAQGYYAAIGGGAYNIITGSNSVISGGRYNVLGGTSSVISGGEYNSVPGMFSYVAGGRGNSASSAYASVSGGNANSAAGMYSAAAGGNYNSASGQMSAIGGGNNNSASGGYSAIPGGDTNQAMGLRSFAAGFRAQSSNDGTFTWADSEGTMVLNSVNDRARFKSRGGFIVSGSTDAVLTGQLNRGLLVTGSGLVGVSTGTPQAALDVVSDNSVVSLPVQIWRDSSGNIVSSMSSAGHMMAARYVGDGSGLTNVAAASGTDSTKVLKTGDTMTGQLTLAAGSTFTVTGNSFSVGSTGLAVSASGVGIGIAAAAAPLHVESTSATEGIKVRNPGGSAAGITFRASADGFLGTVGADSSGAYIWAPSNQPISFRFAGTEKARVHYNGYIAVATSAPTVSIQTSGGILAGSSVTAQGGFYGDGSNLTGVPGDNLGNHTATASLNLGGNRLLGVSTISVSGDNVVLAPFARDGNYDYAISIGSGTGLNFMSGIGIGYGAFNNYGYGVGVGRSADNNYNYGVGLGYLSHSNSNSGVGVGNGANSNSNYGTGLGSSASSNSGYGTGVGAYSASNYNYGVGVGAYSQNNFDYGTGVGAYTSARSSSAALGYYAKAPNQEALALGAGAKANAYQSVAIGAYTVNDATGTAKIWNNGVTISTGGAIQTTGLGHGGTAGNPRGYGAVDLQSIRSAAAHAASGMMSVLSGGGWNEASGAYATVPGGSYNQAAGNYSFAAGYAARSLAQNSFTWSDSGGNFVDNNVPDRAVFKTKGGFLVTGSTNTVIGATVDRGVLVTNGMIAVSTGVPMAAVDVVSSGTAANIYAQVWRNSSGVVVASMSSQGHFSIAQAMPGDNLGTHNASQNLQLNWNNILTVSSITAAGHITVGAYQINGSTVLAVSGGNSLGVGPAAGRVNSGGNNNFIGANSGYNNSSGNQNNFMGANAGYNNTTGQNNTFIGNFAGYGNNLGTENIYIGDNAGYSVPSGGYNSVVGNSAGLGSSSNYSSATLMGYAAGYSLTSGAGNTLLGYKAGYYVTTGSSNIVVGIDQNLSSPADSNKLNIGGVLFGDLAAGTIGISTRTPVSALDVNGTLTLRGNLNSAGDLTVRSSAIGSSITIRAAYGDAMTGGQVLIRGGSYNGGSNGATGGHVVIAAGELASGTGGFNMHAGSVTISAGDSYSAEATSTGGSVILNAGASAAGTPGTLMFKVAGAEKARINNAGSLGIGTASPNYRLDVQGGSINASGGMCIADSCVSSWSSVTGVWTKSGSVIYPLTPIDNVQINSTLTVSGNAFSVGGSAFSIAGGKVGIGTSASSALLDVRDVSASSGFVLRVGTGTASDTASLVVTTGGIVGVGTLFPSTQTVFHAQAVATDKTPGVEDVALGLMGSVRAYGTGAEDAAAGGDFEARADGVQNVGYLVGVHTSVERTSPGVGTVGKAIGLYVDEIRSAALGTGKITDTYGVYIGTMATENQTNAPYSVYALDQNARSYFAGKVGAGTANPLYALEVSSAAGSSDKILMVSTGTSEIFSVKGNGEVYTAGKFIGDGSMLANVNAASLVITGSGLNIATSAYAGASGVFISSGGAVQTAGAGHGSVAGAARGLGAVDLQTNRALSSQVASGLYAAITGGKDNTASGDYSVAAGNGNSATSFGATVAGGFSNTATGTDSVVAGGIDNDATNFGAAVGGGRANVAGGESSFVGGGGLDGSGLGGANKALGKFSAITGGTFNVVDGSNSVISGGAYNVVSATSSVISGGEGNTISGIQKYIAIGGGYMNVATGQFSRVGGGWDNRATAWGASIGGGIFNRASDSYGTVAGGSTNTAGGYGTFVGGGDFNQAIPAYSAVVGGTYNNAYGGYSFVGGGAFHTVDTIYATVAGGRENKIAAGGDYAFIGGGEKNSSRGAYSFVGGGGANGGVTGNMVDGAYSAIVGGSSNTITSVVTMGFIGGGSDNHLYGDASVVGGGSRNTAGVGGSKFYAAVLGGHDNQASGEASFVGGGNYNIASGNYSMVPGGANSIASGDYSFAAGYRSSSTASGAFSWADGEGYPLVNDIPDQTRFKAKGGFWVAISTDYSKPGLFVSSANNVSLGVITGGPGTRLTVLEPNPQPNTGNSEVLRVGTGPFPGMLYVSTSGVVGMSQQSVAIASAPPMALAGTGWNPINSFNFEEIDTQNEMTTVGFTTRNPGRYLVTFDATMQCAIANNTVGVGVGVNGEAVPTRFTTSYVGATGQNAVSFSHVFNLNAGSLLQFYFYNTLASAFNNFVPMVTVTKLN